MTVQEIREAAKVMEAYANGKKIQYLNDDNEWIDAPNPLFDWDNCVYRIKPEDTYRPFETKEECWEEMHKHPDFGWLVNKNSKSIYHINVICCDDLCLDETPLNFVEAFTYYEFLDGSHFGIKEEQQ